MWAVAGILAVGAAIAWLEAPRLVKRRFIRELWWFAAVLAAAIVASALQALDVPLPNPMRGIDAMHKPISDLLFGSPSGGGGK